MNTIYRHCKKNLTLLFLVVALGSILLLSSFAIPYNVEVAHASIADSIIGGVSDVLGGATRDAVGAALGVIGFLLQIVGGWFMSTTGMILDAAIPFSLNSGNFVQPSIALGWTIFRDIVNVVFIFILLYVAFMTILQAQSFNTKRVLAALLIVALLVNFSFFITGFVIDVGNTLAFFIYSAIVECPADPNFTCTKGIRPISEIFAQGTGISQLLDRGFIKYITNPFEAGLSEFMAGVFYITVGSVFLSGAILFVLRTVTLIFVLVLSPIAFTALILPATRQYWNQWLHKLMGHTFVAPVYLLLIAVVAAIINSKALVKPDDFLSNIRISEVAGGFQAFLTFMIFIGLIQGSLIIAKRMAGDIAGMSVKWSGKITGAGIGVAAFAGRNILGRGSAWAQERYGKGWKEGQNEKGIAGIRRRMALKATTYGKKATYDARNVTGVSSSFKTVSTGADVGRGTKESYQKTFERREKREQEFTKSLGKDEKAIAAAGQEEKTAKSEVRKAQKTLKESERTGVSGFKLHAQKEKVIKTKLDLETATKNVKLAETKRQREYAQSLASSGRLSSWILLRTRGDNRRLAESVRKDTSKSKQDRAIDAIKELGKSDDDTKSEPSPPSSPSATPGPTPSTSTP